MKKYSLLIALAMLTGIVTFSPVTANAQDEKQIEFERTFYDACYTKKDMVACIPLAKELLQKYPSSTYKKYADGKIKESYSDNFTKALNSFYAGPDAPKLDQLIKSADEYLAVENGQTAVAYVNTRVALATTYGSMAGMYKDTEKAKAYSVKGLELMSSPTPPTGWDPNDYQALRNTAQAQLNQFLGYQVLQAAGDPKQAVDYLNKAIAVKHKDGLGWKDPNNYWLRSNATFSEYQKYSKEYQALTDEEKTAEKGKSILSTQVNPTIDRMIADYARVVVTANKPETKTLKDEAQKQLDQFWKYRTDKPEALPAYLKLFEADPTIADPPVPAKVETTDVGAAGVPPEGSAGAPKLTTAVSGTGSGAAGGAASNGKTTAPATKGKAKSGKKGKRG